MGKNNRQRRAMKAKQRARARHQRAPGGRPSAADAEPLITDEERVSGLLWLATRATVRGDDIDRAMSVEALAQASPALVAASVERDLIRQIGLLWDNGWQPAEVTRQVRRGASATASRLVAAAIEADHSVRDRSTIHPAWAAQVAELDAGLPSGTAGWLLPTAAHEQLEWYRLVEASVGGLAVVAGLGPLPTIVAPPGSSAIGDPVIDLRTPLAEPLLERVRALLAKAESTEFEAEATTFTAKAQELMARHAIDSALLWNRGERREQPDSVRIPIDDPYTDAKSLLLHFVAEHSRCRSVFHPSYAMASVVGFADDLTATDVLFTSLLVQAQTSLQAAAASAPPGSRPRSRGFRSSFLLGYADRIGQRLAEINDAVTAAADAEHDGRLLPVLVERSSVVDDAFSEQFGNARERVMRGGNDFAGWSHGTLAADQAELTTGAVTPRAAP